MSVWELWLPIVAAGFATHLLSTLAWTVLPHHKPEWRRLALGDGLDEALKSRGAEAGEQYLLSTSDDEHDMDPGKCRGTLILWDHTPSMGKNIGMTLAYFFATAFAIAYLASMAFSRESAAIDLFRFTATAALLTHAVGRLPSVIWFRRKFLMDCLDGVAYALATGAAFALLWPR